MIDASIWYLIMEALLHVRAVVMQNIAKLLLRTQLMLNYQYPHYIFIFHMDICDIYKYN